MPLPVPLLPDAEAELAAPPAPPIPPVVVESLDAVELEVEVEVEVEALTPPVPVPQPRRSLQAGLLPQPETAVKTRALPARALLKTIEVIRMGLHSFGASAREAPRGA